MSAGGDLRDELSDEFDSWVLDSLVGFLKGPVWHLPLLSFIEQKSVVFEPDDEDANEEEYAKIFEEYKNLVDRLIGGHMDDLGISPEQFEEACKTAHGALSAKFHQNLFEQIWAANDYDIFKRMMIQRNIDLQLQALEMLAQRYGLIPESFLPDGQSRDKYFKDDGVLLEEVLKRSLVEAESEKHFEQGAGREKSNVQVHESPEEEEEDEDVVQADLDEEAHAAPRLEPRAFSALKFNSNSGIGPEEIKLRQEYLRKQRDKLLASKKKERQKQMSKVEESERLAQRPKSAKVMRSVVDQDDESPDEGIVDNGHAFRMSLAARLKAEVIDSGENDNRH